MNHLLSNSLAIIRAGQSPGGAYVASPTFPQYRYCWLRDGTWIAYAMDRLGAHDSARAFYRWVGRTLLRHEARLGRLLAKLADGQEPDEEDYLPTRFRPDGEVGQEFWWDFQLDGYGSWLWGLCAHLALTGDEALWEALRPAVRLTVRYLEALWQSPNYDCWEEFRDRVHISTLAALYGGLSAVERQEAALVPGGLPEQIRRFVLRHGVAASGHFCKFVGNEAVDASLLWVAVPYGVVDVHDERFGRTLAKIERDLRHPQGGVYRYAADTYYGGGEWLLLTAWLGWVYVELGRVEAARQILGWVEAQATPEGQLPEQVSGHLLAPAHYAQWEQRWGPVACPLLWSHAMYLILAAALGEETRG